MPRFDFQTALPLGNMGGSMPPMSGNMAPIMGGGMMAGKGGSSDMPSKISKFIKDRVQLEILSNK